MMRLVSTWMGDQGASTLRFSWGATFSDSDGKITICHHRGGRMRWQIVVAVRSHSAAVTSFTEPLRKTFALQRTPLLGGPEGSGAVSAPGSIFTTERGMHIMNLLFSFCDPPNGLLSKLKFKPRNRVVARESVIARFRQWEFTVEVSFTVP